MSILHFVCVLALALSFASLPPRPDHALRRHAPSSRRSVSRAEKNWIRARIQIQYFVLNSMESIWLGAARRKNIHSIGLTTAITTLGRTIQVPISSFESRSRISEAPTGLGVSEPSEAVEKGRARHANSSWALASWRIGGDPASNGRGGRRAAKDKLLLLFWWKWEKLPAQI